MGASAAYWLGQQTNDTLQRVYGVSFPDAKLLKEHLHRLEEAKKVRHSLVRVGSCRVGEWPGGRPTLSVARRLRSCVDCIVVCCCSATIASLVNTTSCSSSTRCRRALRSSYRTVPTSTISSSRTSRASTVVDSTYLCHASVLSPVYVSQRRSVVRCCSYTEVVTPNVFNVDLWRISGHYDHYLENMFTFPVEGSDFGLKVSCSLELCASASGCCCSWMGA